MNICAESFHASMVPFNVFSARFLKISNEFSITFGYIKCQGMWCRKISLRFQIAEMENREKIPLERVGGLVELEIAS